MKSSTHSPESLSALVDGELDLMTCQVVLDACRHDDRAFIDWRAYHLIGDVLRSRESAVAAAELDFLTRLNRRLASEPIAAVTAQSVQTVSMVQATKTPFVNRFKRSGRSANDDSFRWKLVAGLASLAAVSAIAWNASGLINPAGGPQLALAPASQQLIVASPQGPIVRDARLEELLAAHRQLGGASALQAPSGFLQNAAFETRQPGAKR